MKNALRSLELALGLGGERSLHVSEWIALSRRRNILGVVCRGRADGGGGQLHGRASALAFSRAVGLPLFHAPLETVAHGEGTAWIDRWERLIDFRTGFEPPPARIMSVKPYRALSRLDWRPKVLENPQFHGYCDPLPWVYGPIQDELRCRCAGLPEQALPIVAVHIRRGDIMQSDENAFRRIPIDRTARLIEIVRAQHPHMPVHVFSEGHAGEFDGLPSGCVLHLNEDVFENFILMASAHTLVLAKSSLSYLAGVLCRGRVIYEPFWHAKLPNWTSSTDLLPIP